MRRTRVDRSVLSPDPMPRICVGAVREPPTDRANPNNMGDRCCVGWGGHRVKTARAAQDVGRFTNRPYGDRGLDRARVCRTCRCRAGVSSNNSRPSLYVGAVREPPTDRTHPDDMGDRCCVGWGRTPRENDARREREWCRTRASGNITAIPVCGRFTNRPYGDRGRHRARVCCGIGPGGTARANEEFGMRREPNDRSVCSHQTRHQYT